MIPTLGNGKICYVEIPANNVQRSAEFYEKVFDWKIRKRGDGAIAFDDGVGEVSGTWVTGRPPATTPGLLIYIMVDSVAETVDTIIAHGGSSCSPLGRTRRKSPRGSAIPRETSSAFTSSQTVSSVNRVDFVVLKELIETKKVSTTCQGHSR